MTTETPTTETASTAATETRLVDHREARRARLERDLEEFVADKTEDSPQRGRALVLLRYLHRQRTRALELSLND